MMTSLSVSDGDVTYCPADIASGSRMRRCERSREWAVGAVSPGGAIQVIANNEAEFPEDLASAVSRDL